MSRVGGSQKGWVLIDTLIALVVLAVALLAVTVTLRQSVVGTVFANNRQKAAYLAQQQLSDLRRYDGTGLNRESPEWARSSTYADPNTGSQQQFQLTTGVLPVTLPTGELLDIPPGLANDVVPVYASVQWTDSTGPQILTMVTYYY